MKILKRIFSTVLTVALVFGLTGSNVALAATNPSLGLASTFAILASTFQHNGGGTTITGDVGYAGEAGTGVTTISGTTYVAGATTTQAGIDQGAALTNLNGQACTFSFAAGAIDLATDTTHGTLGIYTPGVYCITGAASIGTAGITLSGNGTYIFRVGGALTSAANSSVTLANGASSCDVFWTPTAATTLGANSTFAGTDIDASGVTVGSTVTWNGRILASGGTVTVDTDTINSACSSAPASGLLTVVKVVVNDSGGSKAISDFPLFVNGSAVVSGIAKVLSPGTYAVTETTNSTYTQTFSASCPGGSIAIGASDDKICTITNDDIAPVSGSGGGSGFASRVAPIIEVVKVPSPLALPAGPGLVTYSYTLRNLGTETVDNVTMVDDSCRPLSGPLGDTNANQRLEVGETWIYHCAVNVPKTHTNTVVATGWANNISTTDIANATVIVGSPADPPLIHVTKVPRPLSLPSAGGFVTYTERLTNPGKVALNNIKLTDDKCAPLVYLSGDKNRDSRLDPTETWVYSCRTRLTQTTTNTAVASGEANGVRATDFAIATVLVSGATPKLPNTGLDPEEVGLPGNVAMILGGLALVSILSFWALKKRAS